MKRAISVRQMSDSDMANPPFASYLWALPLVSEIIPDTSKTSEYNRDIRIIRHLSANFLATSLKSFGRKVKSHKFAEKEVEDV